MEKFIWHSFTATDMALWHFFIIHILFSFMYIYTKEIWGMKCDVKDVVYKSYKLSIMRDHLSSKLWLLPELIQIDFSISSLDLSKGKKL